jgi:ligand-binding SRPBCC domain-containing protein
MTLTRSENEKTMAKNNVLERTQLIQKPLQETFAFFADAGNLEAITPHFLGFRVVTPTPIVMCVGARIDYELSLFGLPLKWRTRIAEWEPGRRFVDEQEAGPYALWHHSHDFEARGEATLMRDRVEYREPLGPLGAVAHVLFVERTLMRIFDHRHEAIARLLDAPSETARHRAANGAP